MNSISNELDINQPLLQANQHEEENSINFNGSTYENQKQQEIITQQQEENATQQITDSSLSNNQKPIEYNDYWISLTWNNTYHISVFYINNVKTHVYLNDSNEWKEALFKNEERKGIDEFVVKRNDGGVMYYNTNRVKIHKFEALHEQNMIEYDRNGDKVYEGECKGDMGNGFHRSGYGKEFYDHKLFYEGEWNDDIKEGVGKCYMDGEVYYEGEWVNDLPSGNGKLYGEKGIVKYEGVWKKGYIQVDDEYYCYLSGKLEALPNIKWIWSEVIIGLLYLLGTMLLSLFTEESDNIFSLFAVLGFYYLAFAFFHQFNYRLSIIMTIILFIVCLIHTVMEIFENYQSLYTIMSQNPIRLFFFLIFTAISPYIVVSSIIICYNQYKYSFPFNVNLFTIIYKKNMPGYIYTELYFALTLINCAYFFLWNYEWRSNYHYFDLRICGFYVVLVGVVYMIICYFQAHDDDLYSFGVWSGFIGGIFFTVVTVLLGFSISTCENADCIIMMEVLKYTASVTVLCSVLSYLVYHANDIEFQKKEISTII